jgi:hypothetical protein
VSLGWSECCQIEVVILTCLGILLQLDLRGRQVSASGGLQSQSSLHMLSRQSFFPAKPPLRVLVNH